MHNQKGFIGIVIVIIVALTVVSGGGYYVYQKKQKNKPVVSAPQALSNEQTDIQKSESTITTTKQEESILTGDIAGAKVNINIKADITQTVDCGSDDCFQKKFVACQPATLQLDAGFGVAHYKIIGPSTGGCSMTFVYTKNPNPAWVNKEMTCTFDNTIGFQKSIENTFNAVLNGSIKCEGPLYTVLRSM